MKKIILAALILLSVHHTYAQRQDDSSAVPDLYSNAERFADSAGTLIQKEYIRVGHILACSIYLIHYTDMVN
jgi:hypothetical protein